MTKKPSGIIFDLDGTLVDSAADLTAALNHVLKASGRAEMSLSHVRHLVGDGARALIIKGFSETGALPDAAEIDIILAEYLTYYAENISAKSIIFPGAIQVIEKLAEKNIPLGLCTNKVIHLADKLMTEIGLADYFTTIIGGDSFDYQKPDPRHITGTLDKMNSVRPQAIMVGDTANDIIAAQKAGLPVIAVSFGYSKIPISAFNPDIIIDHYDEFLAAVDKISEKF